MIDLKWLTTYMAITHALPYNVIRTVLHHLFFCDNDIFNTVTKIILKKCIDFGLIPYIPKTSNPAFPKFYQTGDLLFGMHNEHFLFTTTSTIENSTSLTLETYDGSTVFAKEGFPVSPAEFFTAINKVIV